MSRPRRNLTTFELARLIAPTAPELLELQRRFVDEEVRLTAALGVGDPPTFADFVAWIVERAGRPPHRPSGRPDRHPDAHLRRSQSQRQRRLAERGSASEPVSSAA